MWGLPQMTAVPESDVNCGVQAWLLHSAVEASGTSSFPTPPLSSPVQNSANKVYFRSCCECLVRQCEGLFIAIICINPGAWEVRGEKPWMVFLLVGTLY